MKKPEKRDLLIAAEIVFIFLGGILETLFKYKTLENSSLHMLILLGSTLCFMSFVFLFAFYIIDRILKMRGLNVNYAVTVGLIAAFLVPVHSFMYINDNPVLPVHSLWLELKDITSKPADIGVNNASIVVTQHSYRGSKTVKTYFEYEYNGTKYRVPTTDDTLSLARTLGMGNYEVTEKMQLTVYPNTGIVTDIVSPVLGGASTEPVIKKYGMPYTLFVNGENADYEVSAPYKEKGFELTENFVPAAYALYTYNEYRPKIKSFIDGKINLPTVDGSYKIVLVNSKGNELSNTVAVNIKNGAVESDNNADPDKSSDGRFSEGRYVSGNDRFNMTYDEKTGKYTAIVTPMALGTSYDKAVIPSVKVTGDENIASDIYVGLAGSALFDAGAKGYLGEAYNITSTKATSVKLTFTYDKEYLADKINENFRPAIYCLYHHINTAGSYPRVDEDYSPVPDQIWEGNTVTATITGLDSDYIYMLIDEYEFLHWQEEYAEYWRKFKEEDPEKFERMKKSQEEINEKIRNNEYFDK